MVGPRIARRRYTTTAASCRRADGSRGLNGNKCKVSRGKGATCENWDGEKRGHEGRGQEMPEERGPDGEREERARGGRKPRVGDTCWLNRVGK